MSFLRTLGAALRSRDEQASDTPKVLNVGGNSKAIPIPKHYDGWEHLLLDIDPAGKPDVVCDARELGKLPAGQFDAVYCSHNLEHYYPHDVPKVIAGFLHVLKDDGFAEVRVPDIKSVVQRWLRDGLDINDVLYQSPAGPITIRDVIYGFGAQIERTGVDFFAHKTGFTPKALADTLTGAGFGEVVILERPHIFEVAALAFKTKPSERHRSTLNL